MNQDTFTEWLKNYTNIKPYSIGRYSKAIGTISSELEDYGLEKINLFNLTNTDYIDTILNNPEFKKKNEKGHRMYSVSLNHLKRYIGFYYDSELQTELFKEEEEFQKYLTVNPASISRNDIEDKPKDKPKHRTINYKKVWIRNPKYASEAVAAANYLCESNNQHKHFISKFNGENYVEAHHLIPMMFQEQFDCSLDVHANIVSLCLVCHKKLHFSNFEEKQKVLKKLFEDRSSRLFKTGITVSLEEIYSYYKD